MKNENIVIFKLNRYVKDCIRLRAIIENLIDNLEFIRGGGTIIYALDFSEIYSYLIPTADVAQEYTIVSNENQRDAELIQRLVLYHILFESKTKHILLPQYALELEGFVARLQEGSYNSLVEHCLAIYQQLERLPISNQFLEISEKIHNKSSGLTEDDLNKVYGFIIEHIPGLINLLNPPWEEPYRLLGGLFTREVFQNATELGISWENTQPEQEIANRWYEQLLNIRGQERVGSSEIDALAIGSIYKINKALAQRDIRVVLVTRSQNMHSLATYEIKNQILSNEFGYPLVHTLSFYFHYGLNTKPIEDIIDELKNELKPIKLFLSLIENKNLSTGEPRNRADDLYNEIRKHLFRITKIWKAAGFLDITYGHTFSSQAQAGDGKLIKAVVEFFKFINNSDALRSYLNNKITELHEQLHAEHEALGVYIETADSIRASIGIKKYGGKFVLGTNRQAIPYTFQFYSEDAGALFYQLNAKETYSIEDALPVLINGFKSKNHYERLLAMAFILGSLSKWGQAEKYCIEALDERYLGNDIFPHEGYFFLAICKRKWRKSKERFVEALELLAKANSIKQQRKKDSVYMDPRYIHEMGVDIILCRSLFKDKFNANDDFPEMEKGLQFIERALSLSESDKYLKVQALNNIIYYSTNIQQIPYDEDKVKGWLKQLIKRQRDIQPNLETWPGFILDTIATTRWKIYGLNSKKEIDEIKTVFNYALRDAHLDKDERESIESHLSEFIHALDMAPNELI